MQQCTSNLGVLDQVQHGVSDVDNVAYDHVTSQLDTSNNAAYANVAIANVAYGMLPLLMWFMKLFHDNI